MKQLLITSISVVLGLVVFTEANKFAAEPEFYGKSAGEIEFIQTKKRLAGEAAELEQKYAERDRLCAAPGAKENYGSLCD